MFLVWAQNCLTPWWTCWFDLFATCLAFLLMCVDVYLSQWRWRNVLHSHSCCTPCIYTLRHRPLWCYWSTASGRSSLVRHLWFSDHHPSSAIPPWESACRDISWCQTAFFGGSSTCLSDVTWTETSERTISGKIFTHTQCHNSTKQFWDSYRPLGIHSRVTLWPLRACTEVWEPWGRRKCGLRPWTTSLPGKPKKNNSDLQTVASISSWFAETTNTTINFLEVLQLCISHWKERVLLWTYTALLQVHCMWN